MESTLHDKHSAAPSEVSEATGDPADTSPPLPQRRRRSRGGTGVKCWPRRHKIVVGLSAAVMTTALVLGVDVVVLVHRPVRIDIVMPSTSSPTAGETWLILGTNSCATVPGDQDRYGTTQEMEGSRVDVIALVRPSQDGLTAINLPRDLTINSKGTELDRLATTYVPGPQNATNALCTGLGISTTHLVTTNMVQLATITDSLGGVEVDIPEPIRDAYTGLNLTSVGHHRLSGTDTLALVRSRYPEILRDGSWVAMSQADDAQRRSQSTATVMQAILSTTGQRANNPISPYQLAYTVAGNITLDSDTGLTDLASLGRSASRAGRAGTTTVVDLPTGPRDESIIISFNQEPRDLLAGHGHTPKICRPAGAQSLIGETPRVSRHTSLSSPFSHDHPIFSHE